MNLSFSFRITLRRQKLRHFIDLIILREFVSFLDVTKCFQMTLTGQPILSINVQPASNREGIIGYSEWKGELKIAVEAIAEGGKANKALIHVISESFNLPKEAVEITSGLKSRSKKVKLATTDIQLIKGIIERKVV